MPCCHDDDSAAPLDHTWSKEQRAERLTRNYQRNYRSNKHGQHNRARQLPHKQLCAADRKLLRQEQSFHALRRGPTVAVQSALHALLDIEHPVGNLRKAIRDVKRHGLASEPLGVAVFLQAHELLKAARAALAKSVPTSRALEASELVAFIEGEVPPMCEVPADLRASAQAVLREAQGVSGSLLRVSRCRGQVKHFRKPQAHQKSWAWNSGLQYRLEAGHKTLRCEKRLAKAEVHEFTKSLAAGPGRAQKPRPVHLRSGFRVPSVHDAQASIVVDTSDSELHVETGSLEVRDNSESNCSRGLQVLWTLDFSSIPSPGVSGPSSSTWHSVVELMWNVRRVCAVIRNNLRESLKGVLEHQDSCRRLAQLCHEQKQLLEGLEARRSDQEVTVEDAWAGLQEMRRHACRHKTSEAVLEPWHTGELLPIPLPSAICFSADRKDLRIALAKVSGILQAVSSLTRRHPLPAQHRRRSEAHECVHELLAWSCTLHDEVSKCSQERIVARQRCVNEHHEALEAFKRRNIWHREVLKNSEDIIAEWRELGRRSREECARELPRNLSLCEATQSHFDALRDTFLREHGHCIRRHLQRVLPCSNICLRPVAVSLPIQAAFLEAWRYRGSHCIELRPAFHGTKAANLKSIFERGLLIPGQGNRLTVVHGAAHGRGIYTAKVSNPWLSYGFARSLAGMLVVGVLDDATAAHALERMGVFPVQAQSKTILHVGDAMVVFEPSCVIPFFSVGLDE